jgi:predicted transcriptional regulator
MPRTKTYTALSVALSSDDQRRLAEMAKELSAEHPRTKSDLAREAIRWYLDHYEKIKEDKQQSEITQALQAMTNRICGMLARQGAEIGTLYELAWLNHKDNKIEERFTAAANTVKANMRKRLTDDERRIAESMKKVVES